ncbi:MAG TPA: hypothetical protein VF157_10350 [Chloroflexota bacterium]
MTHASSTVTTRPSPQWPLGKAAWGAQPGFGTFLTLEFGAPAPSSVEERQSRQHGQWHLWVRDAAWEIRHGGHALADRESSREAVAAALKQINGKRLRQVLVEAEGLLTLRFDADLQLILRHTPTAKTRIGTSSNPTGQGSFKWPAERLQ